MPELILASKSPRRRELMALLGYPFTCTVSSVEENRVEGESPADHVMRLSEMKAKDVGQKMAHGIVIGSDTVVVLEGEIIEKPLSPDDAVSMLTRLQNRSHTVYTGFSLYDALNETVLTDHEKTKVTMRAMTIDMIKRYVATGEPLDKAGAYGIQGYGSVIISSITGCYFNVMGLPLARLMEALKTFSNGEYEYFDSEISKSVHGEK